MMGADRTAPGDPCYFYVAFVHKLLFAMSAYTLQASIGRFTFIGRGFVGNTSLTLSKARLAPGKCCFEEPGRVQNATRPGFRSSTAGYTYNMQFIMIVCL